MTNDLNNILSTHYLIIILVLFNIFILITFTCIYNWCDTNGSFKKHHETTPNNFSDHLSLSISIQSGVGLSSIIPISTLSKILVSLQEFIVMTSTLISIYIIIIFSKNIF